MEKINESIYSMYQKWVSGDVRKEDYHDYVDLGLPSGLLWATCNIGADSPVDKGEFYHWGGVKSIEITKGYDATIPYYNSKDNSFEKYNHKDNLTTLEPNDDAGSVLWGGRWRMPTKDEIEELFKNTEMSLENNCALLVGKNDKKLYIPISGFCNGNNYYDSDTVVAFWSSTIDVNSDGFCNPYEMSYFYESPKITIGYRGLTMPIRCVMDKK